MAEIAGGPRWCAGPLAGLLVVLLSGSLIADPDRAGVQDSARRAPAGGLLALPPRAAPQDAAVAEREQRLRRGDRLAIAGDSITEQKLYSRYIELYLDVCVPDLQVRVMSFGWSGERVDGLLGRLRDDVLPFRPDIVTLCYGMNDGLYQPFVAATGRVFEQGLRAIIAQVQASGSRVIVGLPGMVDPDTFSRDGVDAADYNECLSRLAEIARSVAAATGCACADIHAALAEVIPVAKKRFGTSYHVCGHDGIHPAPNGHLVMAQAFLESLGVDGRIGTITVRFDGPRVASASASAGHAIVTFAGNRVTVESSRWPFCFTGEPTSPLGTRSIAPLLAFNERLNRLVLRVAGLPTRRAVVTWGATSRPFSRSDLEKGINLAASYVENPFVEPFRKVEGLILDKQRYETEMIKRGVAATRVQRSLLDGDREAETAWRLLYERFLAKADRLDEAVRAAIVPVRHTIEILPDPGEIDGGRDR